MATDPRTCRAPRASAELTDAARSARRLGLVGGSFDPPHRGHLHLARLAREARHLDHVLWVPAAHPPHKPERVLAGAAQRAHMLELLLSGSAGQDSIWTVEFERRGPSYTVDTLRLLRAALEDSTRVFLVLGSDNLPGLAGWRELEEVLRLAEPIVVPRDPGRGGALGPSPEIQALPAPVRRRIEEGLLAGESVDVSSTEVRRRLAQVGPEGHGPEAGSDLEALLPGPLREYLVAEGIYRVS